ncbi:MAG: hypothetical protein ACLTE2_05255 [Eubacteriales bacterium]
MGFSKNPQPQDQNRSMQHFLSTVDMSKLLWWHWNRQAKGPTAVGKFPSCVLHIELSYCAVDVNVHPNKLEVRLSMKAAFFDAVYHGTNGFESRRYRLSWTLRR